MASLLGKSCSPDYSHVMRLMSFVCLYCFPFDVLGGIWNLIVSVSELIALSRLQKDFYKRKQSKALNVYIFCDFKDNLDSNFSTIVRVQHILN